jgi:hypothetical protein
MKVSLEFKNVPLFLREILAQPPAFQITGLDMTRVRERVYGTGRAGEEGQMPPGMRRGGRGGMYPGGGGMGGVSPYMMGGMRGRRRQGQQRPEGRGEDDEEEGDMQRETGRKKLVSVTIQGYVADYLQEGELKLVGKQLKAEQEGGKGTGSMPGMGGMGGGMTR